MKFRKNLTYAILLLFVFNYNAFSQRAPEHDSEIIRNLKSNLEFLASDELGGREMTTLSEKIASQFIASELKKYGVKPYGDDGSYFQTFNVKVEGFSPETNIIVKNSDGSVNATLRLGEQLVRMSRSFASPEYLEQETGLVFAGYGVVNEEHNYDDYESVDVNGKTVLLLSGEPDFGDAKAATPERRMRNIMQNEKITLAVKHGAAGVIIIANPEFQMFWKFLQSMSISGSYSLPSADEKTEKSSIPVFTVDVDAAKNLLTGEQYDYDKIMGEIKEGFPPSRFRMNKNLKYDVKLISEMRKARNVVGIVEGKDASLKSEMVAMSAHYDHIGITNGVVNNGADDDGSGTVTVLELARELAKEKNNRRSFLFVFHTGEEKGLLGSQYMTENFSGIKNIVCDINMDMVGRESADSIHCIGSDKLSAQFFNLIEDVNKQTVNLTLDYKYNDPNDPNRFYYRSDHYNYAKQGIPIVFFFDDMKTDYHKPTDDVDKINFKKMEKVVVLADNIARSVANLDHRLKVAKVEGQNK